MWQTVPILIVFQSLYVGGSGDGQALATAAEWQNNRSSHQRLAAGVGAHVPHRIMNAPAMLQPSALKHAIGRMKRQEVWPAVEEFLRRVGGPQHAKHQPKQKRRRPGAMQKLRDLIGFKPSPQSHRKPKNTSQHTYTEEHYHYDDNGNLIPGVWSPMAGPTPTKHRTQSPTVVAHKPKELTPDFKFMDHAYLKRLEEKEERRVEASMGKPNGGGGGGSGSDNLGAIVSGKPKEFSNSNGWLPIKPAKVMSELHTSVLLDVPQKAKKKPVNVTDDVEYERQESKVREEVKVYYTADKGPTKAEPEPPNYPAHFLQKLHQHQPSYLRTLTRPTVYPFNFNLSKPFSLPVRDHAATVAAASVDGSFTYLGSHAGHIEREVTVKQRPSSVGLLLEEESHRSTVIVTAPPMLADATTTTVAQTAARWHRHQHPAAKVVTPQPTELSSSSSSSPSPSPHPAKRYERPLTRGSIKFGDKFEKSAK